MHLALAADEAEEQWLESRPQLAIVELMISGGRGAELCRRLKQHDAGAVLAVSVLEARDEALAAGADAFLQKPLDPLELVSTVKDLLGASALVARRGQESRLVDERGTSGDEGLDRILGGGLPLNGINLIMGRPGSGKTILCQQFMFARATEERPAVYLSTVSEPFEKILRYAQTLSFFDRARDRPVDLLRGPRPGRGRRGRAHRRHRADRRADQGATARDHRDRQLQGAGRVRRRRARVPALPARPRRAAHGLPRHHRFWIGEYSEDESRTAPEFAVADGIISLATERVNERTLRLIEVTKLRGSDFRSGRHAYRLSADGITVFPRLADPIRDEDYRLSEDRISSGIAPLDTMLAEGYAPGQLHAGGRAVGRRQDLDGAPLHLQRRRERRARRDREPAGEPDPTAEGRPRLRLVAGRRARGRHVPVPQRRLHRRMGLRAARPHRDHRRHARHDRQPQRPAVRDPRSRPLPRVHLLAHATPLARRHQPDHDQRDTRTSSTSAASPNTASRTSPTTSSCCSTCAPNHASCAP